MSQFHCIVVGCPNTGNPCGWPRLHWLIVKSNPLVLLSHFWISLRLRSFWKEILLLGEHALPIEDHLNFHNCLSLNSSWWTLEFSSDIVSAFQSPLNGKGCRAKYQVLNGIKIKIFLFLLFSNACRSDKKSPISPITVLRVPWHILQLPSYANQTIRAFEVLSFSPFHFSS